MSNMRFSGLSWTRRSNSPIASDIRFSWMAMSILRNARSGISGRFSSKYPMSFLACSRSLSAKLIRARFK